MKSYDGPLMPRPLLTENPSYFVKSNGLLFVLGLGVVFYYSHAGRYWKNYEVIYEDFI